ncbi:MAG: glucokinase [Hyphomonadaceae bacterium]|nr:glucokinase [Hyphomonadaceae bacterium]
MNVSTKDFILVGDVGGTFVRLGLAQRDDRGKMLISQFTKVAGDDITCLDDAIELFLKETHYKPKHVSIALAGPVSNGSVSLTNRPWTVSEADMRKRFGFQHVSLYNDFKAMGRSVPEMEESDFLEIHPGQAVAGEPILVAGPGTGFGMANLAPMNGGWHVFGSEGGHVAYAPQSRSETELLHILQKTYDFVSLELVSSGFGMDVIHKAICERHGVAYEKTHPAKVLELAKDGDPVCLEICEVRSAAIMGALGDMALVYGARGGVVLAGGVSERLIDYIAAPKAMSRFMNRGHMSSYLENMPIRLLQNPAAPLIGAAVLYMDETK